jgi:putative ABC transport system permease protein
LILFYIHFETNYDEFVPRAKDKYRVALRISGEESTWEFAQIAAPAAVAFENQFPQVKETVRFASLLGLKVTYQDIAHQEGQILSSDPSFIPFFGLRLLQGNPETALSRPGTLFVTDAMSQKYFGDENPIHRLLQFCQPLHSPVHQAGHRGGDPQSRGRDANAAPAAVYGRVGSGHLDRFDPGGGPDHFDLPDLQGYGRHPVRRP